MHERTITFVLKSTINTQCNVNNLFPFSFFIFKFEHITTSSTVPVLVELYFHFLPNRIFYSKNHSIKSVRIRSFSGPYSAQMRQNMD